MKRITHTPNQVKKLSANKKPRHAANEREVIYACAFTHEGLTPSSMLKFARFFLGVTFRWRLIMFETKFVQQSLRRCPECLVPLEQSARSVKA